MVTRHGPTVPAFGGAGRCQRETDEQARRWGRTWLAVEEFAPARRRRCASRERRPDFLPQSRRDRRDQKRFWGCSGWRLPSQEVRVGPQRAHPRKSKCSRFYRRAAEIAEIRRDLGVALGGDCRPKKSKLRLTAPPRKSKCSRFYRRAAEIAEIRRDLRVALGGRLPSKEVQVAPHRPSQKIQMRTSSAIRGFAASAVRGFAASAVRGFAASAVHQPTGPEHAAHGRGLLVFTVSAVRVRGERRRVHGERQRDAHSRFRAFLLRSKQTQDLLSSDLCDLCGSAVKIPRAPLRLRAP